MTLIYSVMGPELGLIALSDILTSTTDFASAQPVELPLRPKPITWTNDTYASAGTAQKTVIFGKTMIQWAGNVAFARRLIETIYSMSWGGELAVPLPHAIIASHLNAEALSKVQVIYHYRLNSEECWRDHHRCTSISSRYGEILVGGSGRDDFVFNTSAFFPEKYNNPGDLVREVMASAFRVILASLLGDDSYEDAYGGWLEFATCTDRSFRKVPISVKVWGYHVGGYVNARLPLFFATYVENRLIITRVKMNDPSEDINLAMTFVAIGDFLGRPVSPASVPKDIGLQPGIMIHLLPEDEPGLISSLMIQSPDSFGIQFYSRETDLCFRVEDWLTDRIYSINSGERVARVSAVYD